MESGEVVVTYHAFTDERDEWFSTLDEAKVCIEDWRKEGFINLRIYKEERTPDGEEIDESCIFADGGYPW